MMCISVDLPDPDGPMMATYSPSSMVSVIPRQGGHVEGPGAVGLGHVGQLDEAHRSAADPAERAAVDLDHVPAGTDEDTAAAARAVT